MLSKDPGDVSVGSGIAGHRICAGERTQADAPRIGVALVQNHEREQDATLAGQCDGDAVICVAFQHGHEEGGDIGAADLLAVDLAGGIGEPVAGGLGEHTRFTDAAIAAWKAEPRATRGGQPRYSGLAIATALTLRSVFRLALRQTEGLIGSIIALLELDHAAPDQTTLSRRAESLDVVRPRPGSGPVHLVADSTGLKLCGSGEWLLEQHGTKTRRSWRKLHIAVDADNGQIAAAALTTSDVDDASQVRALLDQVDGPVASFTADGA